MVNAWVEHVRKWSKENNTTYMCAIGNPKCREAYTPIKKTTQTEAINLKNYYDDYKRLSNIRDEVISYNDEQKQKRARGGMGRGGGYTGPTIRKVAQERYNYQLNEFRKNYPNKPQPETIAEVEKMTKQYLKKSEKESNIRQKEEEAKRLQRKIEEEKTPKIDTLSNIKRKVKIKL